MASVFSTAILSALALVLWGGIGLAASRRLMPPLLVWTAAPILGWAMQNALALPLLMAVGFSPWCVGALLAIPFALAIYDCVRARGHDFSKPDFFIGWMFALAALVAVAAAIAILPKGTVDSVLLAAPIYDHSKIAIVDEIVRGGVPPVNPFFGEDAPGLPYYYLLHFSAAQLASLTGLGGWNADAALTWFTAFSVLLLAMGLAAQFANDRRAAAVAAVLTLAGSARPLLAYLTARSESLEPLMSYDTGLSPLLYQVSWAPQHVMSGGCVVVAVIVLAQTSVRMTWLAIPALALLMAAAFESSMWVGGLVLALGGMAAAIAILTARPAVGVPKILLVGAIAAVAAVIVASPLLFELWKSASGRGGVFPVEFEPFGTVGEAFGNFGNAADYPAFWLMLLPVDLPAIYVPGILGAIWFLRRDLPMQPLARALIALAIAGLCVSWLLASRIGENNDLGWRAILPAVVVLTALAAAGIVHWMSDRHFVRIGVAAAFFLLGLPGGLRLIADNISGNAAAQTAPFAQTSQMWREVREVTELADRVASNPAFLAKATPWPINISWALQSDRRSCYAGAEYALAFVPISKERREEIDAQFTRIFAGQGSAEDIAEILTRYRCRTVVLTPDDGAWSNDAFATSALFRLVRSNPHWRIYRAREAERNPAS